jgi:AraC-like DNA-binding protein
MLAAQPGRERKSSAPRNSPGFSETEVWKPFGQGWRALHAGFRNGGFSVEWHDFDATQALEWSRTFHPRSLEICLNFSGNADVEASGETLNLAPLTAGFYARNDSPLKASRRGGEHHQFITIELSRAFLDDCLASAEDGLHPRLSRFLAAGKRAAGMVSEQIRLNNEQQQLLASLRNPPVFQAAQPLWYRAKAIEAVAAFLYRPVASESLFCERQQYLNRERVQKVMAILKENLAEPPSLEELGKRVGCSHFYLSRIFTQEVGKTISVTLRDLRMERAAALLREGKFNVTQAALEVGYSSLSHFSNAFHEVIGCCPGLYPLNPAGANRR